MIKVLIGDLFESTAQTLVNTVNCVGVMGKGIALSFKKRSPEMFKDYTLRCKRGEVTLGRPYLYKSESTEQNCLFSEKIVNEKWILNFPTKDHWRSVANLDDIIKGVKFLLAHYKEWGIQSLAIPPLGCGEGQLEWRIVGPTLYRYLSEMDIPVELYAPYNTVHKELQVQFLSGEQIQAPKWIPAGWVALVEIIHRLLEEPYRQCEAVGKIIFQKIAYVATRSGISTQLDFQKASYGPFSEDLQKTVLSRLVNNGLVKQEYLGKMHSIQPGPTFADARQAYAKEIESWNPIINNIVDLFMRLNTERAEIVATIMFTTDHLRSVINRKPTENEVFDHVMQWKQDKNPPLTPQKIADGIRNLAMLDWIEVKAGHDLPLTDDLLI